MVIPPRGRTLAGGGGGGYLQQQQSTFSEWTHASGGTSRPLGHHSSSSLDDQNNNNNNVGGSEIADNGNEQLVLHFPKMPPGSVSSNNNNNMGESPPQPPAAHQSVVSQYGFQTHRPRPPLNRAIPPIPESRSNESIQSSTTLRTGIIAASSSSGTQLQQQTTRIIDENNPIDEPMVVAELLEQKGGKGTMAMATRNPMEIESEEEGGRMVAVVLDTNNNGIEEKVKGGGGIAEKGNSSSSNEKGGGGKKTIGGGSGSKLPKFIFRRRREKSRDRNNNEAEGIEQQKEEEKEEKTGKATFGTGQQQQPKSPLMSVAHSVKNKICRLTKSSSKGGMELPISKSLDIATGQRPCRIPQPETEVMHKSWSMEEQQEMPRRMPATTLLPSAGLGIRRLPPDDEHEMEEQLLRQQQQQLQDAFAIAAANKQVQFAPLPYKKEEQEEDQLQKLERARELQYCIWTSERMKEEEMDKAIEDDEMAKNEKDETAKQQVCHIVDEKAAKPADGEQPAVDHMPTSQSATTSTSTIRMQWLQQQQTAAVVEAVPLQQQSIPVDASQQEHVARLPPRTLPLLRKSPQSFPPLGAFSNAEMVEQPIRPTKSTMSVSFGTMKRNSSDGGTDAEMRRKSKNDEGSNAEGGKRERENKRRVFSTKSLRIVASRVCEVSPLVRRRQGRSANREEAKNKDEEKANDNVAQQQQLPIASTIHNKMEGKQPKESTGGKPLKAKSFTDGQKAMGTTRTELRPVQSVRTVQSMQRHQMRGRQASRSVNGSSNWMSNALDAPLAESESSRVENSPAMEQCAPWFESRMLSAQRTTGMIGGGGNLEKSGGADVNNKDGGVGSRKGGGGLLLFGVNTRLCKSKGKSLEQQQTVGGTMVTPNAEKHCNGGGGKKAAEIGNRNNEDGKKKKMAECTEKGRTAIASTSSNRPTLAQLLASPIPRKKSANQAEIASKKQQQDKGLIDDEIKDQPMLISTSSSSSMNAAPIVMDTSDFRLIDEPSSSSIHLAHHPASHHHHHHPTISTSSPSSPSLLLIMTEQQQQTTGDEEEVLVNVQMVEQKMQTGLCLAAAAASANTTNQSRKRNASPPSSTSDLKKAGRVAAQQGGVVVDGGGGAACSSSSSFAAGAAAAPTMMMASCSTSSTNRKNAETMPWADESVKSDDGVSPLLPGFLGDFRADLLQLRDTVQRDLDEMETLRLQNAALHEQLAERDRIIAQLQKQLRNNI